MKNVDRLLDYQVRNSSDIEICHQVRFIEWLDAEEVLCNSKTIEAILDLQLMIEQSI